MAARRCCQLLSDKRSQFSVSAVGPLKTRELPEFPSEACLSWPLSPGAVCGDRRSGRGGGEAWAAREDGAGGAVRKDGAGRDGGTEWPGRMGQEGGRRRTR